MNTPYSFNLLTIAGILSRRKKFILFITLAAGVAGLLGAFIRPKQYEAKAEFYLKNPFYADRNFVYNSDAKYIDYFAGEDDVARLIAFAHSDTVQLRIIRVMHLYKAYHVDTANAKEVADFRKNFTDRLNLWRTDSRGLELASIDKDARRAAAIANLTVALLEQELQHFYTGTRASMHQSVLRKIAEQTERIQVLTDSLVALRELYSIYDIISPSRYNLMLGNIKNNGKPGFARGIEQIQNIESMKDEMVSVRSHNLTLAEQYATGNGLNEMPLIYMVKQALPPQRVMGMSKLFLALTTALCGFFFACILILITNFYRRAALHKA